MGWEKLPVLDISIQPCLCCPPKTSQIEMDTIIAVGFGAASVTRNGECVYSEAETEVEEGEIWTVKDAEERAKWEPDNDWRIHFYAPLYEAHYQRHGKEEWMLVEKGEGFA